MSINKQLSATQVAFILVVGIGVLLRLLNLEGKIFWIDEAFTALNISGYSEIDLLQSWQQTPLTTAGDLLQYQFPAAGTNFVDVIRGLAATKPQHAPFYFILARWWVQLWGDSIAVLRSFSAIASIATLPMLALLSRELFANKVTAYLAVALMAVSPFQVLYAQEARHYSLWTLGIVAMSWALLWAGRSRRWQAWLLYGVFATLSLYTFVYTVFVLLAHGLYVLWQRRTALMPFLLSGGMSVVFFLPWVWTILQNRQAGLENAVWQLRSLPQWYVVLPLQWLLNITRNFVDFEQTYSFGPSQLLPYGLVVLVVVAGVGYSAYQLGRTTPVATWSFVMLLVGIPALSLVIPDLLLGGQQSLATRYFAPCWVGLLLMVAHTLTQTWHERWGKWAIAGILTIGFLSCTTNLLSITGWHKTGAYLPYASEAINRTPAPFVVSGGDVWILSMAHYLNPETPVLMVTQGDELARIPQGYSHYFLYSLPEPLRAALTQSGLQIASFEQLDRVPLWCLFPPGQPPQNCPPKV